MLGCDSAGDAGGALQPRTHAASPALHLRDVGTALASPQAAEQKVLWGKEQTKAAADRITFLVLRPGTREKKRASPASIKH